MAFSRPGRWTGWFSALILFGALFAGAPSASAAPPAGVTGVIPGEPGGNCPKSFQVVVRGKHHGCTHPDSDPPGIDRRNRDPIAAESTAPTSTTASAAGPLPCYGDGQSGPRVQAIYAYPPGQANRSAQLLPSMQGWAAATNQVVANSAAETGGVRHIRFVTDAACSLSVAAVAVSSAAAADFAATVSELEGMGFNRSDRKYLVWMDAAVYCGIADIYVDDRAGQNNANNGLAAQFSRVDRGCWGVAGQSIEAHELMHNLGGVQTSAPHATSFNHCSDDAERMCYADGSGSTVTQVCPATHENVLDCNSDDYFSTAPPAGSYLATHWNTANSAFLANTEPTLPSGTATGRFTSLAPARILDTRYGTGGFTGPVGPGQSISFKVLGVGGVPASGVSAVVLNVAVTAPTNASYLTVYPSGTSTPNAANLNFNAGQTTSNAVVAKVGADGKVTVFNAAGWVLVIADVNGWFSDGSGVLGGLYSSLAPARI
ncbi:MAG: hypothetical protein ACR2FO_05015, partial [Actinomycetota bacterium]